MILPEHVTAESLQIHTGKITENFDGKFLRPGLTNK
jgi:hypothetical protein